MKSLSISTLLLFCGTAVSFSQAPPIGNCTVFPSNNIWNTPIDTLPVSPNSATYVSIIGSGLPLHPDFGSGTYNGAPIGIPFITVPGTQTKYPATFTYADESDPGPYAIPLNAPIEGGSGSTGDRHAIAVDTDNCILYELYAAYPQTSSWQAGSGAIFDLKSNALRPATWTSADAAGLPIMPGLAQYREVLAGEIRHALRFTVPKTLRAYVWPARHYASTITDPSYPPMGQRFRLKANFDISTYPADMQVILRALKKYGMMIADNGSAWFISGDNDPGWNNDHLNLLKNITGSAFEAVDVSSLMVDPNSAQAIQPGISVTVTPGSATLLTGATQQFTAAVQNSADQSVTWAVNGMLGGSSAVGFVSASGLYTAPAAPPSPSTVTVQATSVAFPSATGSASVTVKYPAPIISSVSPNPVTIGSFTLTVNGAGFQNGAVVKLGGTALSTAYSSSSQLSATGSTSTLGNVPVTVLNPDGQASNSYTISVISNLPVSVAVSPSTATVRTRHTVQFTATVENTADTRVTWQVNGISGGNSSVGTISSTGLYTAPGTVPSPSTVSIRAVSVADPTKSATASATIVRK